MAVAWEFFSNRGPEKTKTRIKSAVPVPTTGKGMMALPDCCPVPALSADNPVLNKRPPDEIIIRPESLADSTNHSARFIESRAALSSRLKRSRVCCFHMR